mgnify:CR=1 FL=1
MKKILLGLFFAMFAMQVNAATMSLTGNGDSDVNSLFVSVSAEVGAPLSFEKEWAFSVNGDLTGFVKTSINDAVGIDSLEIFDGANLLHSVGGATVENLSLTYRFLSGVNYTIVAMGLGEFVNTQVDLTVKAVPVPAAVWLFGSALMGLFGVSRRKSSVMAA